MEAILKREIILNKTVTKAAAVAVFVFLTALGAFLRIPLPFTPVPLTLQTFFVLLGGACMGSSLGLLSQFTYCLLGVLGLPIFSAAGSGLLYLAGPTGGYLFGFLLAGFCVAKFIRFAKDSLLFTFLGLYLADILLLFCGSLWLKIILGCSLSRALSLGLIPFLAGDFLKTWAASALYLAIKPRLKEIF